ncbi:hypothetical protein GCM10020366_70280 [Saccharopolyspora gregorii]|uniref:Uncharacterized protein n=1 Tax=Saccharopolyspora gregorii TaxID=33914 RepID=A0ABP6S2N1_9PSEU
MGEAAARLLPDGARVLTHCWGDLYLTETVAAAQRAGKELTFYCTETRPTCKAPGSPPKPSPRWAYPPR